MREHSTIYRRHVSVFGEMSTPSIDVDQQRANRRHVGLLLPCNPFQQLQSASSADTRGHPLIQPADRCKNKTTYRRPGYSRSGHLCTSSDVSFAARSNTLASSTFLLSVPTSSSTARQRSTRRNQRTQIQRHQEQRDRRKQEWSRTRRHMQGFKRREGTATSL